jgi:hypothetical protein
VDLALQVGVVSDETVKYGREFCGISIQESLHLQGPEAIVLVNYRPILSSERVPHIAHQIENKTLAMGSRWKPYTKTEWPNDRR